MFVITQSQLTTLEDAMVQRYIGGLTTHFRTIRPKYLPDTDELLSSSMKLKIQQAKSFGFEKSEEIERFLYLCYSYKAVSGPELPPVLLTNLTWPDRPAAAKLEKFYHELLSIAIS